MNGLSLAPPGRKVKVAVIGSGLAGLTAAHLLSTNAHEGLDVSFDVHLFEKSASLGMDSHSISISGVPGQDEWRIDVPMRSFQGGCYPEVIKLYRKLGVQFVRRAFTYSFTQLSSMSKATAPNFIYNGKNGLRGISLPSLSRGYTSRPVDFLSVYLSFFVGGLVTLVAYIRLLIFYWTSYTLPGGALCLVGADTAWKTFVSDVLVPLFAAVCTAPTDDIWQHPVEELLDYVWLTMFTPSYVAMRGVREVVRALSADIPEMHIGSAITELIVDPETSQTSLRVNGGEVISGFAHIIFATQANTAAHILRSHVYDESQQESPWRSCVQHTISLLDNFRYVRNIVINHTDERILPPSLSDRRELNFAMWPGFSTEKYDSIPASDLQVSRNYTMATHVLPRPAGAKAVFQTTNPTMPIASSSILSIAHMERMVLTAQSKAARVMFIKKDGELGSAQGIQLATHGARVWFCGSYAGQGIPLLEGCVVSARSVVEKGVFAVEGVITAGSGC